MLQLPPRDRALLHLYDARAHLSQDPSPALTQQGISSSLDVNRTHITRVLKPLVDSGMVEAMKGRLEGGERKLTYYVLTPLGLARAREIIDSLANEELEVVEGGRRVKKSLAQVMREHPHLRALQLVDSVGGVLRPQGLGTRLIDSNVEVRGGTFYGREEQLAAANEFLSSDAAVLAVYANHGYGSSTFLRKLALDLFTGPVLWHDLSPDGSPETLRCHIDSFLANQGLDGGIERLRDEAVLICLDNYRDVSEELVDMLVDLLPRLKGGRAKMAVAMREETPSYDRFYLRPDVLGGGVVEVHLHRFDEATAKRMLGGDIDDEAFQLIYMLTRGQPLALAAVRDGDEVTLRRIRLSEEVRFLMYLRTRRKSL